MARGFNRARRINDLIQTTLAEIIQREAKDLRFGMTTITGVSVAHDLSFAKIFVSVLEEDKAAETVLALNNAAKYLRYSLANAVELRVTPELKFIYDDSTVRGNRISSLINNALKDNKSNS
jgi:ribosome-binding factor A